MGHWALSMGVKHWGLEGDYATPSWTKIRKARSFISTSSMYLHKIASKQEENLAAFKLVKLIFLNCICWNRLNILDFKFWNLRASCYFPRQDSNGPNLFRHGHYNLTFPGSFRLLLQTQVVTQDSTKHCKCSCLLDWVSPARGLINAWHSQSHNLLRIPNDDFCPTTYSIYRIS
jgi:hypothetical protein